MSLDKPTLLTNDFRRTAVARAVPYSIFMGGAWYLPSNPDPESARIALRLFPRLQGERPELVARARLSRADYTPIDHATERWRSHYPDGRFTFLDPWHRVRKQAYAGGIEPHEFQRIDADYAIDRLNSGRHAYFGWEMGLGKTLGACMVIDGWDANFVFIACPNSAKMHPWAAELARFCPWLGIIVVGNTKQERAGALQEARQRMSAGEPTALICHYQAIPLIEGPNKRAWKPLGRWDLVICDEAHLLKTRTAKFTSAVRRLDAVGHLFLSGSVMSGAAEDLFIPWQIAQPKRYRSQWRDWNDRFLEVIQDDFGRNVITGPALHRLDDFRAELGESLTVRLAKDHLNVPEPVRVDHQVELLPEQSRIYREVADELLAELPDGTTLATVDGAPLRTALRRVTGGVPAPCPTCHGAGHWREGTAGGQTVGLSPAGAVHVCPDCCGDGKGGLISAKLDRAMELIEAAGDSQVLVFTWHKLPGYELVRRLKAASISAGLINGDVATAKRAGVIDLFQRGGYRVLVATLATLSTAANLQNASVVIMVEESDDPIDNEQGPARAIRQGQLKNVSLHIIRAANTVDDLSVWPNHASKSELRRLVLGA